MQVSRCCEESVVIELTENGQYHVCDKCGRPCDVFLTEGANDEMDRQA